MTRLFKNSLPRKNQTSIKGARRPGISDEGRGEAAGAARVLKTEDGSKIKRLRPGWTAHQFRGVGSGAPRKNRTLETRRSAQSIRDVAFAGHREFVAEARPRCGLGGRRPLV